MCMTFQEVDRRVDSGEKPADVAARAWRRKLKVVEYHEIESGKDLENFLDGFGVHDCCALCDCYASCEDCPLPKVDTGKCCLDMCSLYDYYQHARTQEDLEKAINSLVVKLCEAAKLE